MHFTAESSVPVMIPAVPDFDIPFANYQPPSALPSEDVTSSGGLSLVPPSTGGTTLAEWHELPPHLEYDEQVRSLGLELPSPESPGPSSTAMAWQDPDDQPCLPWKFEFWWQDGALHSPGGPLKSTGKLHFSGSSHAGVATAGDSVGISESPRARSVVTERPTASVKSEISLDTAVRLEDEAWWLVKQRRGLLTKLLIAHYWRTHPPQRSGRRDQSAHGFSDVPRSAPYTSAMRGQPSARGKPSRRLVNNGGYGEDEGDDQDDDDLSLLPGRSAKKQPRNLACPFQKWRPQHFHHCHNNRRYISDVGRHVKDIHYTLRCPECHTALRTQLALTKHSRDTGCGARPTPDLNPSHISEQQLAAIQKLSAKRGVEMQWRRIFSILFPDDPQPRSIYFSPGVNDFIDHFLDYSRRRGESVLRLLQAQQAAMDPFFNLYDTPQAQREAVLHQQFIPTLMLEIMAQDPPDGPPQPVSGSSDTSTVDMPAALQPLECQNRDSAQIRNTQPVALSGQLTELDVVTQPYGYQPPGPPRASHTWYPDLQYAQQPNPPSFGISPIEFSHWPTVTGAMNQPPLVFSQLVENDIVSQFFTPRAEDFSPQAHPNNGDTFHLYLGGGGDDIGGFSGVVEPTSPPRMQAQAGLDDGLLVVPVPPTNNDAMSSLPYPHATSGWKMEDQTIFNSAWRAE